MTDDDLWWAQPTDAVAVLSLIRGGLEPEHLAFTVFRSESALGYLHGILAQNTIDAPTSVRVAGSTGSTGSTGSSGEVAGVCISSRQNASDSHLSYLVVAAERSNRGIGTILLRDLERRSRVVTLDVFASNVRAESWYRRRGYERESERFLALADLQALNSDPRPAGEIDDLDHHLAEELRLGFANVLLKSRSGEHELGLVGGDLVRLRGCVPGSLSEFGIRCPCCPAEASTSLGRAGRQDRRSLYLAAGETVASR